MLEKVSSKNRQNRFISFLSFPTFITSDYGGAGAHVGQGAAATARCYHCCCCSTSSADCGGREMVECLVDSIGRAKNKGMEK